VSNGAANVAALVRGEDARWYHAATPLRFVEFDCPERLSRDVANPERQHGQRFRVSTKDLTRNKRIEKVEKKQG
jgi:hypothetical protein